MKRLVAILLLGFSPGMAFAHPDRILPIKPDGTLADLPAEYGPVRISIVRSKDNASKVQQVVLSSPKFRVTLNKCVIDLLGDVTHVEASGSWYHERGILPPYVSLDFYSGPYNPRSHDNQYSSVTYSLVDGRILMGTRMWKPLIGGTRGRIINPADKCSHWQQAK